MKWANYACGLLLALSLSLSGVHAGATAPDFPAPPCQNCYRATARVAAGALQGGFDLTVYRADDGAAIEDAARMADTLAPGAHMDVDVSYIP